MRRCVKRDEQHLSIAIADPTWQCGSPLTVEIDASAEKLVYADERITVIQLEPAIVLQVNLCNGLGQSCHAAFDIR